MIYTNEGKIKTLKTLVKGSYPDLPYHNFPHAIDVLTTVRNYGFQIGLPKHELFLLESGALVHDADYTFGKTNNEEGSVEFARTHLPYLGYTHQDISKISGMIMATKMPQKPRTFLEQLLCDADVDNLGRTDFAEKGEKIRTELGLEEGPTWYRAQLGFLTGHEYHTDIARELRNPGKQLNQDILTKRLEQYA